MFKIKNNTDENTWLSLSDMMTMLFVLFLILAIFIASHATKSLQKFTEVLDRFVTSENMLCKKLKKNLFIRFDKQDLQISCEPIRITFINDNYKFEHGKHELPQEFKETLNKFFPIYLDIVSSWNFENKNGKKIDMSKFIDEVRIEGHTDSAGTSGPLDNNNYIYNMGLSQRRSKEVVQFAFTIKDLENKHQWMRDKLTANGLSFSRRLNNNNELLDYNDSKQIENKKASRRIEIKLRTKARELITQLRD